MSDNGKKHTVLDKVNIIATLIILVLGTYFQIQNDKKQGELEKEQNEMNQRAKREELMHLFTGNAYKYIDKLELGEHGRGAIIELLDIIARANISETGKPDDKEQKKLISLIPLRLALITEQHDILAHITNNEDKLKLWVDFAEKSSNKAIKETALKALGELAKYDKIKDPLYYIKTIMSISNNLERKTIRKTAIDVIEDIKKTIEEINITETPELTELLEKYHTKKRDTEKIKKIEEIKEEVVPPESGAVASEISPSKSSGKVSHKTLPTDNEKTEIQSLISNLKNDDTVIRRDARKRLIKMGNVVVGDLMNALTKDSGNNYRLRLGVVYVLYKIDQPIIFEEADREAVNTLIGLIGASEAEIRKYASEFLMKLDIETSVNIVLDELLKITKVDDRINTDEVQADEENKIYNSVVILGTWHRILPAGFDDIKKEISTRMNQLKQKLVRKKWGHTREVIEELMKKSS